MSVGANHNGGQYLVPGCELDEINIFFNYHREHIQGVSPAKYQWCVWTCHTFLTVIFNNIKYMQHQFHCVRTHAEGSSTTDNMTKLGVM